MVDVKKHRPENIMLVEVGTHTQEGSVVSGGAQIFGFVPCKKYCMVKWSSG